MPRSTDGQALLVQEVTTAEALGSLAGEWAQLWRRDPSATCFQSPAWLIPWWRRIGRGALLTLALRTPDAAGELVGLVPLYVYTQPASGSRDVFPLGVATTDYLDGLFAPGWAGAGAAAALAHLDAVRQRWDACELSQLRPDSPLLMAPAPAGWGEQVSEAEACPALALPDAIARPPNSVPARMRHNLAYYRKRAARLGEVRFECADTDNLDELFDALLALHRARWRSRGESGVLADEAVQRAHRESLPELLRDGLLRLYALRLDGRIVAVLYGLVDKPGPARRFYYYLGGFDPDLEHISPGTLLIGHALERAVEEGAATFDFLRGREGYKYLWGATDTPLYRRRLWHGGAVPSRDDAGVAPLGTFEIALPGVIRPCRREDLPTLEWFGLFAPDRQMIRQTFARHERGEAIMLVAEVNGVASGQAWVDLGRKDEDSTGVLWAIRVFPSLQGRGIGSMLIAACEQLLRDRGFRYAELTVERDNPAALRLYERLGYERAGDATGQWVLRKRLTADAGGEPLPPQSPRPGRKEQAWRE